MVSSGWNSGWASGSNPANPRPGTDPSSGLAVGATAGLISALAGAVLWTVIVEVTGYRIGYAAIGLGLLVGQAIAVTKRTSPALPLVAALLALFSCLLGDLFVDAHQLASATGVGTPTVVRVLVTHPDLLREAFVAGWTPLSLAFWAIAAVAAYRLAARGVELAATERAATERAATGLPPRAVAGPEFTGPSAGTPIPVDGTYLVTRPSAAYSGGSTPPDSPTHQESPAYSADPVPARTAFRHPADFFSAPSAPRYTSQARRSALAGADGGPSTRNGRPNPAGPAWSRSDQPGAGSSSVPAARPSLPSRGSKTLDPPRAPRII
jgi:hypothetical protein